MTGTTTLTPEAIKALEAHPAVQEVVKQAYEDTLKRRKELQAAIDRATAELEKELPALDAELSAAEAAKRKAWEVYNAASMRTSRAWQLQAIAVGRKDQIVAATERMLSDTADPCIWEALNRLDDLATATMQMRPETVEEIRGKNIAGDAIAPARVNNLESIRARGAAIRKVREEVDRLRRRGDIDPRVEIPRLMATIPEVEPPRFEDLAKVKNRVPAMEREARNRN